jgi:hypothetical protein
MPSNSTATASAQRKYVLKFLEMCVYLIPADLLVGVILVKETVLLVIAPFIMGGEISFDRGHYSNCSSKSFNSGVVGLALAPVPPPITVVPNQMRTETPVTQVITTAQMSLRTPGFLFFFHSKTPGCSEIHLSMKNEITGRFVPRGPGSEPVKGAPRKPTGSRRDRHHQLPPAAPGSSARGSNIPTKVHTPATTATQPTTAGSGKRRPS